MNNSTTANSEKKIRFRSHANILYTTDNKVEELYKNEATILDSPTNNQTSKKDNGSKNVSLLSFLHVELTRGYLLEHDEERYSQRREKVYSFMKIPREVEKFMSYGFMQCTDSFLFVYTFLPLRVALALWALLTRPFAKCFGHRCIHKTLLTPAEICDLLKAVILLICSLMMFYIDTNMMYHLIKSQSVIKLYIFYNMLEVGDRLFSAFGQDTIDALFWTATEPRDRRREHLGVIPHLVFAIVYVFLHSLLVLFQATTLNVAINSNNKALLTIMMSNNFVELKGSVFKKFDKNNLFQVACSDVRERFHLITLLFIVVLQTMKEYAWKPDRFWVLLPDCLIVLTAEIFVDWIKHAFITRFNELKIDVYKDYTTSLAYDMAQTRQKFAFSDHSDLVARRMGFIPLPLGVVMIRILFNSLNFGNLAAVIIGFVAFLSLASLRILNSLLILGIACYLINQHKNEQKSPKNNQSTASNNNNKDTATSPIKNNTIGEPILIQPAPVTLEKVLDLNSAAIFSNSTVDLKNVSLNEELLKVEVNDDLIELSKSEPMINAPEDGVGFNGMKKRAESEPSLLACNVVAIDDDEVI